MDYSTVQKRIPTLSVSGLNRKCPLCNRKQVEHDMPLLREYFKEFQHMAKVKKAVTCKGFQV